MKTHGLRGQALLITVLVLTIALTVALSLIRRTTADVKTTNQLEESARAFSVAEAGIEDVLKRASGTSVTIQSGNGSATFETTFVSLSGTSAVYTYPSETQKGEVATLWLVPHTQDNALDETGVDYYCKEAGACTIEVCWEQPVNPTDVPAIEMTVLYRTIAGLYDIQRFAYDPDAVRLGNSFTRVGVLGSGCGRASGVYTVTLTLPTTNVRPLALRLRPYYNKTAFIISPLSSRTLPSQGFEVSSTGKTESGMTRKIIVKRNYDSPASIFDFVLYSNTILSNSAYQN
jgi:hypothetical protein